MRVCGIAVAVVILIAACGKKRDREDQQAASVVASIDGIEAVPADSAAVFGIDIPELVASPLVGRAVSQMFLRDPGLEEQIRSLLDGCEFDLGADVESALIALVPGEGGPASEALLVAHGELSEGAIAACVGRTLAAGGGALTSVSWEGRTLYRAVAVQGGRPAWLGFGSDRTVVVASAQEALENALGDGPKLATNEHLAALVQRAGTGATVWGAGQVDPEVGGGLVRATGDQVEVPRAIFGHLGLGDGLDLLLAVEMSSDEDASTLISIAKPQISAAALMAQRHGLGRLVQRIESRVEGATAVFSLGLSAEELAAITSVIDNPVQPVENPGPESDLQGDRENGQGDAASEDEAPVRK